MSLSIFTNTKLISLEDGVKEIFMHKVLRPDENNQVMPTQTFSAEMMERAAALVVDEKMTQFYKREIIEALEDLKEGDRFLMNTAQITNIESAEAKYYWRIVALMNDGSERTPTEAQGIARMGEREFDVRYRVSNEESNKD